MVVNNGCFNAGASDCSKAIGVNDSCVRAGFGKQNIVYAALSSRHDSSGVKLRDSLRIQCAAVASNHQDLVVQKRFWSLGSIIRDKCKTHCVAACFPRLIRLNLAKRTTV